MRSILVMVVALVWQIHTFSQTIRERIRERREQQKNHSQPGAPDYSDLYYWAAHPYKHDNSDSIPAFLKDEKRDSSVDVFFLHPTTYTGDLRNAAMNADLGDSVVNGSTDRETLLQVTAFNGSARVFSPRYRQAHLKAYFRIRSEESQQAFDLAYADLKNAFQYYLDHFNHGRPIIIASHSQGSMHALRLLKEFFDGKPLQKQLVCAYVVGWQIKKDDLVHIPFGTSPTQTGCIVGWRTYQKDHIDPLVKREAGNSLCVNPISWTTDTAFTKYAMHKGAVGKDFNRLISQKISAGIAPGANVLWVDVPADVRQKNGMSGMKNLHVADFNLFWMDVRSNVRDRVVSARASH